MAASKLNYIILYLGDSQVYGASSKTVALQSPPPTDVPLESKRVFFVTYAPDNEELTVHPIPQEEVLNAEIKQKPTKEQEELSE